MISCRFLDKNEVQRLLPQLFSILHENMSVIAPTGNTYDEDYALWSGAVAPAIQKENRHIVLIFNDETLIGYLQYYYVHFCYFHVKTIRTFDNYTES